MEIMMFIFIPYCRVIFILSCSNVIPKSHYSLFFLSMKQTNTKDVSFVQIQPSGRTFKINKTRILQHNSRAREAS